MINSSRACRSAGARLIVGLLPSVGMDVFFMTGQAAWTAHCCWRKLRPGESALACTQARMGGMALGIPSQVHPKPSILPVGAQPAQAQLWLSTGMRKSDFQKPVSPQRNRPIDYLIKTGDKCSLGVGRRKVMDCRSASGLSHLTG